MGFSLRLEEVAYSRRSRPINGSFFFGGIHSDSFHLAMDINVNGNGTSKSGPPTYILESSTSTVSTSLRLPHLLLNSTTTSLLLYSTKHHGCSYRSFQQGCWESAPSYALCSNSVRFKQFIFILVFVEFACCIVPCLAVLAGLL